MRSQRPSPVPFACVLALTACSAASYRDDADREVWSILEAGRQETLGGRAEWVLRPESLAPSAPEPGAPKDGAPGEGAPAAPAPEPPAAAPGAPPTEPPRAPQGLEPPPVEVYDLPRALATAVEHNRDYLSREEALFQQGLSVSLTRFDFGPQFTAAMSALWSSQEGGTDQSEAGARLGVSQLLPTGGTLALTSSATAVWPYGEPALGDSYATAVGGTLSQPLLRGAGYEVSHEALTQAERGLVYAIRDFELFREDFTIGVTRTFYDLTSQQQTLANEDANYEGAVFDRRKAEALHQVDRNTEQEVFRARRREIEAKDQLIEARAAYDRALDEFKILLGLPTTARIDIAPAEPPYEPVRVDESAAVAAARHNRLDLITRRQQVEDAERALRLSENGLLPDLDLVASYGLTGAGAAAGDAGPDRWSSSVGLEFEVPLRRKAERNAYRSTLIQLEQARRDYSLRLDRLDLEIRDALRRLKSLEERIELQRGQIEQERAAVTVSEIRYESGKLDNRDLLEARQALVTAQNALIRLKVEHFIARLSLLRDMGLFFVDERGMWR